MEREGAERDFNVNGNNRRKFSRHLNRKGSACWSELITRAAWDRKWFDRRDSEAEQFVAEGKMKSRDIIWDWLRVASLYSFAFVGSETFLSSIVPRAPSRKKSNRNKF